MTMPLSTRTVMMLMIVFWVHLSLLDNQQVEGVKCYSCGLEMNDTCNLQNGETAEAFVCNPNFKYCFEKLMIVYPGIRIPIWTKTCVTEQGLQEEISGGYSCDTFKHESLIQDPKNPDSKKTKICFCSTDLCNKYISLTDHTTTTAAASQNTTDTGTSDAPSVITGCSRLVVSSLVLYFFF